MDREGNNSNRIPNGGPKKVIQIQKNKISKSPDNTIDQNKKNMGNPRHSYFKIWKNISTDANIEQINNMKNKNNAPSLVLNLYWKYASNIAKYFEANKNSIQIHGSSNWKGANSATFIEAIRQNNEIRESVVNDKKKKLIYISPAERIKKKEKLNLAPLPEKSRKTFKSPKERKEFLQAERAAVALRTMQYTHGIKRQNTDKKSQKNENTNFKTVEEIWKEEDEDNEEDDDVGLLNVNDPTEKEDKLTEVVEIIQKWYRQNKRMRKKKTETKIKSTNSNLFNIPEKLSKEINELCENMIQEDSYISTKEMNRILDKQLKEKDDWKEKIKKIWLNNWNSILSQTITYKRKQTWNDLIDTCKKRKQRKLDNNIFAIEKRVKRKKNVLIPFGLISKTIVNNERKNEQWNKIILLQEWMKTRLVLKQQHKDTIVNKRVVLTKSVFTKELCSKSKSTNLLLQLQNAIKRRRRYYYWKQLYNRENKISSIPVSDICYVSKSNVISKSRANKDAETQTLTNISTSLPFTVDQSSILFWSQAKTHNPFSLDNSQIESINQMNFCIESTCPFSKWQSSETINIAETQSNIPLKQNSKTIRFSHMNRESSPCKSDNGSRNNTRNLWSRQEQLNTSNNKTNYNNMNALLPLHGLRISLSPLNISRNSLRIFRRKKLVTIIHKICWDHFRDYFMSIYTYDYLTELNVARLKRLFIIKSGWSYYFNKWFTTCNLLLVRWIYKRKKNNTITELSWRHTKKVNKWINVINAVSSRTFFYRLVLNDMLWNNIDINSKPIISFIRKGFNYGYWRTLHNVIKLHRTRNIHYIDKKHNYLGYCKKVVNINLDGDNQTNDDISLDWSGDISNIMPIMWKKDREMDKERDISSDAIFIGKRRADLIIYKK